jgi:hypothetical protein
MRGGLSCSKQIGVSPDDVVRLTTQSYRSPSKDAANMIGEGVSKIDMLIATGQIQGKKSGRNLLITVESLERYVAGLPPADLRIERKYQKPARPAPDAAKG